MLKKWSCIIINYTIMQISQNPHFSPIFLFFMSSLVDLISYNLRQHSHGCLANDGGNSGGFALISYIFTVFEGDVRVYDVVVVVFRVINYSCC